MMSIFPVTSFLFIGACALLCAYTLHKVRLVHLLLHTLRNEAQRDNGSLYRQLEALQGLYVELGLRRSLPGTRGWAASPDFLQELARHALDEQPQVVVECSSGTSTVVLARCMQMNGAGMVYSLEHDPAYARRTRRLLQRHGLDAWAVVLDAPLQPQDFADATWPWYDTRHLPVSDDVDMLVIDGPSKATRELARYPAGPALFARLAPGAAVFLDDALRPDEQAILQRWADEYPEMEQSQLPCEKGLAVLRYRPRA